LIINQRMAAEAAVMLFKLALTRDLRYHCAYVNLDAGTSVVWNSRRIRQRYTQALRARP
jgi:hypothetical protein